MSITLILGICLLGCDLAIYFLYEWAFGEDERIRRNQAPYRQTKESKIAGLASDRPF
jgi:hypothetical protein